MRVAAALLLVALVVGPGRADGPAPLAPAPLLERIARCAVDLAKRGRRADADELIEIVGELSAPAADVAAGKDAVAKALAKAKPASPPFPDVVKTLTKLAADLAATLPAVEGDAKTKLARQTLRIDGANRAAHEAAGDVERDGKWVPAPLLPCLEKRAALEDAIRRVRRFEIPVKIEPADDPLLTAIHGDKGVRASWGDISIQSASFGAERLRRALREGLRATALVEWMLRGGDIKLPEHRGARRLVAFDKTPDYRRALDAGVGLGVLTAENAAFAKKLQTHWQAPTRYGTFPVESDVAVWTFIDAFNAQVFDRARNTMFNVSNPLKVGMLDLVASRYVGVRMPRIVWEAKADEPRGTSDTPQKRADREAMMRVEKAGFAGMRQWLRWLVRRDEAPAFSRAIVDEMGKIAGDEITKCTFVVDHLFETGRLTKVIGDVWDGPCAPATYEKALGSLAQFELGWRDWLLADDPLPGLVQTLSAVPGAGLSPVEAACVAHLDSVRRRALPKDAPGVTLDRELSDGCRAHALYCDKHPAQLAAWPDAHEEYADQEGFTAEGARAGLASVIMPGPTSPQAAIDGWMATFYHRLPLLAPGLVRIGWGMEKTAVLDATSLAAPPEEPTWVAWPAAGAKDVPRRFAPELPSPVEGEDQSTWGYPVTLQFFAGAGESDVRMTLCVGGKRGGALVPCHFSTPNAPTNDKLAPTGAFCLIPKQPLAPNTTYTVAVDAWPAETKGAADWTFTTGK